MKRRASRGVCEQLALPDRQRMLRARNHSEHGEVVSDLISWVVLGLSGLAFLIGIVNGILDREENTAGWA